MGEAFPTRILAHSDTVDEVHLQGTFNLAHTAEDAALALHEVIRCLKPGGTVHIHALTADRPLPAESIRLPGPAAVVQHVPPLEELLAALAASGLAHLRLTRYAAQPCFQIGDAELRETMIEAVNPQTPDAAMVKVLYQGPFAELRTDDCFVFRRGQWTQIDRALWTHVKTLAPGAFICAEQHAVTCGTAMSAAHPS